LAVSKRTGRKSIVANDFLIPLPPGPPVGNDVGTNRQFDNGAAVVEFSPVALAVSYKIYAAAPGQTTVTQTGTSSPIVVSGLKSNILYTFTVTGINDVGVESAPSDPSVPTLITSVPATPSAPSASSPNAGQDVVSWLAPNSGGKTITGYIWTASDGKTNLSGGNPGGGPTASTSVTVNQEQGTAQTYVVFASNANGDSQSSPSSNSITTTFSFAPFGAFGFSPFLAFAFSPFMAFGFSPFGAFGFSPFMAFGFSPFGAFSFRPPFTCIASNTKISTVDDSGNISFVSAKDLKIGDLIIAPVWSEYESGEFILPSYDKVSYDKMTNLSYKVVPVKEIISKEVEETIIFNNNPEKHFSTMQPILAKKQGSELFAWETTKDIAIGDILMEYDVSTNEYKEVLVDDVQLVEGITERVYRITPEDYLTFIAGDIVCC
jgi:hypothetical protein